MDKRKLFIISGKARHGKTTIAKFIDEEYLGKNKKVLRTSYAKYVKMYAEEITNWDGSDDDKPRTLLQNLGTLIRNDLEMPMFFVNRIEEDLKIYRNFVDVVTIDDARLPIEIDYFKENYDGVVYSILVSRPGFENDLTEIERSNITEIALDKYEKYDYTIVNDGSLEDLRNKIKELIERIENYESKR